MAKQPTRKPEFLRKKLVSLKRKPQAIALVVLLVAFVYYSLNMTKISNTTARIQGQGMGLAGFVTMLFSTLSLVCFLRTFPHRKKTNIPMLVLTFLMLSVIIFADLYYSGMVDKAIHRAVDPIASTGTSQYIADSIGILRTHWILVASGAALTALLPLYAPLIRKINTSVEVEANEGMGEIDISGEDA